MSRQATTVRVPFLDLTATDAPLKDGILDDVASLIDTGVYINGPAVARFERAFAEYIGSSECVGVGSGLDAIRLALLAAGIKPDDEVIVPAQTFIGTFAAVTQARGIPVPVDVSEHDYGLDVGSVEAALTERTRFVVPVHMYGQMMDAAALARLAQDHGLALLEDAAQAHGASRDGRRAGTVGAAAAFSFYPSKNLGAMGDAGAVVTDDPWMAARVRALREHGQIAKYEHEVEGYTSRLDTVQAMVLLRKLPFLDTWTRQRVSIASGYLKALYGVGDLRLPTIVEGSAPVWYVFVVRTAEPEALAASLRERGIGTGRHFPHAPHLTQAFKWLGYPRGSFPVAEALAAEALSLPIYPGMSDDQVEAVVDGVKEFFARG